MRLRHSHKSWVVVRHQVSLPRHKEVEIEAAQLVDGVVGAQAGVAKKEEGEELCGELQRCGAVQDDGED